MKKGAIVVVMSLLACILAFSVYKMIDYKAESDEQNQIYDDLADSIDVPDDYDPFAVPEETENETNADPNSNPGTYSPPDYSSFEAQNSDYIGWLRVEGTRINYPVCQTSMDNPNYYIHRNFYKQQSVYGCPYLQAGCDVNGSDNLIFYGHHMKDGSMFATLDYFKNKSFWQNHNLVSFDTGAEHRLYKVICVFKTTANKGGYAFWTFTDATSEQDYNNHLASCRAYQIYETGETAQYGQQLVTLCTCEYSQNNGRLVVVAARIA